MCVSPQGMFLNYRTADFKSSPEKKITSTDLLNKTLAFFSTTFSLNTSTADLNSSSNDPTTIDAKLKKDSYFTTAHVLNNSTDDLKSSLQESMNTNPENICKNTAENSLRL